MLEGVNPLAADPQTEGIKSAYETANRGAQAAWRAFEERKRELERKGIDLTKDAKSLDSLRELHRAYEQAADVAAEKRTAYVAHLEGRSGIGETKELLPGAMPDGVSKSLIAAMGEKAFDVTSGGRRRPPFTTPSSASFRSAASSSAA
jgi:hypothetical protein